jgi:hypothetical protein
MGKKIDNPELVNELINNLWNQRYSQSEFERKYNSLSDRDMAEVSRAIGRMEKEMERRDMIDSLW